MNTKIRNSLFINTIVIALLLVLSACSNSSKSTTTSTKKVLNWMQTSEITTLDPSLPMDTASESQIIDSNEGLFRYGNKNKLEKGLAKTETVSKNGLTITYTLRKSKWSNGQSVTAKDFVYGWKRTVDPETGSQYSYLFSGVKNADAIMAGKKDYDSLGVKAIGKYKFVVHFDKRVPYFDQLLTKPYFFPENEKAVKKYGSKYGTSSKYVLSNGPYNLVNWNSGKNSWKLEKNKYYWDAKDVKTKTINMSIQKTTSTAYDLYQAGKLDATELDSNQAKNLKNNKGFHLYSPDSSNYLVFNIAKNKFLKNPDIRRAISLAVSRKNMVQALGPTSKVANTISPAGLNKVKGHDYIAMISNTSKSYSPSSANKKLAQKYLNKGLSELGVDKISLKISASDSDLNEKVTEVFQSQLEMNLKNVSVEVQNLPAKALMGRIASSDYDILSVAIGGDYNDPASILDGLVTSGSFNYGGWSNQQYDKLISQASNEGSSSKRYKLLAQAEGIALKDEVWSPLFSMVDPWLIRENVHGVVYNSDIWDLKTAYVTK